MTDQLENDSEDLPEQIAVRMAKREKLNELSDAYPVSLPITHTIAQVRAEFPELEIDVLTGKTVSVAGRVVLLETPESFASQLCSQAMAKEFRPWLASTKLAKNPSSYTKN